MSLDATLSCPASPVSSRFTAVGQGVCSFCVTESDRVSPSSDAVLRARVSPVSFSVSSPC